MIRTLTIPLFFVICLFSACQNADEQSQTNHSIAKAGFVANPQPVPEQDVQTLVIGDTAPDFNLPDVNGDFRALKDFTADILVVLFTCNHCPTAQAYEDRIIAFVDAYKDKGVQLVAITPNSPLGLLYEELGYSDLNDDFETMKLRADYKGFNFPYLYDGDTESVSLKYGPVATPHTFVFDKERKLQYVGRIDKYEKPGTGNAEDLRSAVDALLEGKEVENAVTKTFGCSTKWAWKTEYKEKVEKEWEEKEVNLSSANVDQIRQLVKNEDSGKLRLINAWATWCGPCVLEYPEFIKIQRMYGARDFEFISLSMDKPDKEKKVLEFLKSKQSAVPNYLFSGEDKYEMIEVLDPDWNGALPYTLLIEPGGQVLWSHQGEVDFLELKRAIVEHSMIGRYF